MDKTVPCLDCEAQVKVNENVEVGDVFVCEGCAVELEVISTDPLEFDYLLVEK